MHSSDFIIIGGGPAGSTCARALRRVGFSVTVIDKKSFPRDKTCAGWITPAVVESLDLDLEDYARHNTLQSLSGFITGMIGGQTTRIDYGHAVSYGIRRCEFDHYLLQRSDATLIANTPVKSLKHEAGVWTVNASYSAPVLIGAGGHFCPVARELGAKLGSQEPVVAAQEIEYEMTDLEASCCPIEATIPELYFCRDLKGYGWVFRKNNYLNIGLGRQDNHKLSVHVEEFIRNLQNQGRIPETLNRKLAGHAYLLYGDAPRPLVGDGVLLIGDSAGLAYAQSGEGIRPAVESALFAAETLISAAPDYSTARLLPYVAKLEARLGQRDRSHNLGWTRILPTRAKQWIAERLLANSTFAKQVVLNRWFFHAQQKSISP